MNVDKVNLKFTSNAYAAQKSKQQRSFTGHVPQAVIEQEITKLHSPALKFINKLRGNIGEFQDICINACGTGLLAPIFIKYNPLSKTDEDTRTYSAWRQPVSAVLAILTQGLVTIPFAKIIDSMTNNGWFGEDCNLTPFMEDKYIENMQKKLHPGKSKKEIAELVKQFKAEQNERLMNSLRNENTVYYNFHGENKPRAMGEDKFKALMNRTVDSLLEDEQKELKRCEGEKTAKRFARSEFYRNNAESADNLLGQMRAKIDSTDNMDDIIKFLKGKRKELKSSKASEHLLNMLDETEAYSIAGKDEMLAKIGRMKSHVEKYRVMTTSEQVKAAVDASIAERIGDHKDAISFLESIKEKIAKGSTVDDIEKMFAAKCEEVAKQVTSQNTPKEFRLADKVFAEEVATKLKNLTKSHISGVKRIATLVVALAMLPVSCSLLNWVYPRFMDAVFPNLSSKKHSNEAKDLVDKANKNSEVK